MYSSQIANKCQRLKSFTGVFAADKLPRTLNELPSSLIVNTHKSSMPGEHWVAIYVNENGFGEYFDSFGMAPYVDEIKDFLNSVCKDGWTYNTSAIQGLSSIKCGQFCIVFIWFRNLGFTMNQVLSLFSKQDGMTNDQIVDEFFSLL
jgi:hypothetical protein